MVGVGASHPYVPSSEAEPLCLHPGFDTLPVIPTLLPRIGGGAGSIARSRVRVSFWLAQKPSASK